MHKRKIADKGRETARGVRRNVGMAYAIERDMAFRPPKPETIARRAAARRAEREQSQADLDSRMLAAYRRCLAEYGEDDAELLWGRRLRERGIDPNAQ